MRKVKRKIKNIVRNIILSDYFKDLVIIKKIREQHKHRLERERKKAFDLYALECLELIKDTLDKENIEFWLDFGTLLGAMREKDFIAHDLDLDLGMAYGDHVSKTESVFNSIGIKKVREFLLEGKVVEQTYNYKGLLFDIFYYFYDETTMWAYSFTFRNNKLQKESYDDRDVSRGFDAIRYVNKKRGVEPIIFKGKEYLAPQNPIEHLIANYGPNYHIPIKEWDYFEAPTNREEFQCDDIVMIEYYN